MSLPDWIKVFLAPLETLELPYAVTGSVASMLYGEPRFTHVSVRPPAQLSPSTPPHPDHRASASRFSGLLLT
ncbi:MAG: hypothetical protein SGJ09_01125, partial [Phycisphaerae bacterium]|nr:hypothetical protein [Phycisphaerae bacterium]